MNRDANLQRFGWLTSIAINSENVRFQTYVGNCDEVWRIQRQLRLEMLELVTVLWPRQFL